MKRHRTSLPSVLTAFALAVAACGGSDAGTTSTTAAATTTSVAATTSTTAAGTTTTSTTGASTTTTTETLAIRLDELPPYIAAGSGGISVGPSEARQLIPPIPSDQVGEWVDAAGDGAGGFVYVAVGDGGQVIWWWPAGAAEPQVVSFKPGRFFHGAAVIDGRPTAIVVDDPDPALGAEPREFVQLVDLADGGTEDLRQVGGIEWGAAQVSYRDGVFLVTEINHSCGDLVAFDRDGVDVALPLQPQPSCQIHFEVPYTGAILAPDGSWAYLERHTVATGDAGGMLTHTELVVIRDGAEAMRVEIAGEGVDVGPLQFDGRWALIHPGWSPDPDADPPFIVVDSAGPIRVGELGFEGVTTLRFLETPLDIG